MTFKEIADQLNIVGQCRKYNVPLRQCPQFLFLIMGAVIGATAIISYILGTRYIVDPDVVALIVLLMTVFLLTVSFIIIRSLERITEANRMKTEFISVISHQLRSPISNLKWSTELLISGRVGEIDKKQKEYLKIINDNIERMGELISSLLTVSRIEQGRLPLQKTAFSLTDMTNQIINKFKPYAEASNVAISFNAPPSLPKIFADVSQTKSVIENLLDNAIRYIKGKGSIEITVSEKKDYLLFSIKDTGVGIPQEDQKHIFQKFFRAANVMRHQTQGNGLGLYIVKSIVVQSGGKIWFKSKEGGGTTFWFTMPISKKQKTVDKTC